MKGNGNNYVANYLFFLSYPTLSGSVLWDLFAFISAYTFSVTNNSKLINILDILCFKNVDFLALLSYIVSLGTVSSGLKLSLSAPNIYLDSGF